MSTFSGECYSWYKFLFLKDLSAPIVSKIYQLICEKKLTMIELFYLSQVELIDLFCVVSFPEDIKLLFHDLRRVNDLDLREEFELIWETCFIIPWISKDYPRNIKKRLGVHAPPVFFARGHLPIMNKPTIAVLGAEKINSQEIKLTWRISTYLTRKGFNILSDHTWGVAEHAHKSALRADGTTTGVLTCGFENFRVRKNIQSFGWEINSLFISPFFYKTTSSKKNKNFRRLITMAWADAVVVIKSDFNFRSSGVNCVRTDTNKKVVVQEVPLFVPAKKLVPSSGNQNLLNQGALEFVHPKEIYSSLNLNRRNISI